MSGEGSAARSRRQRQGAALAACVMAVAFALACGAFVWQPTLASFADDSVSYLVMAQVFSPYQPAAPAVAASFAREAFYPPLFPLLLALAGAAHDIARAHLVTVLPVAAMLPVAYFLGLRWLGGRAAALAAVLCIALLPSLWINAKGILSEPLFCLLLTATILALDGADPRNPGARWLGPALLMTALALTRTAALPMAGACLLWAAARGGAWPARLRAAAPAVAAIAAYGLWVALRPAPAGDDYARILAEKGEGLSGAAGGFAGALAASVFRQAHAIVEGWAGSLMLFWVEGRPLRFALASATGLLALAGLGLRLARGTADGWMMAAYLGTLLAWPFHEQMERFLFPAVPVLVLYAFLAAGEAMRVLSRRAGLAHAVVAALLLALCVPAIGFIQGRARSPERAAAITDWYRTPDLARARLRAQVHLDLLDDMQSIRELAQPEDRVMWFAPSYIALLADRPAVATPDATLAPEAYRDAVRASGAAYVFLSRYHPRDTIRDTAWQAGMRALVAHAKPVHTRTQDGGSIVSSILLRAPR